MLSVDHNTCWICVKEVNRGSYNSIKHVTVKLGRWRDKDMKEQQSTQERQNQSNGHQSSVSNHVNLVYIRFSSIQGVTHSSSNEFEKKHVLALRIWPKKVYFIKS